MICAADFLGPVGNRVIELTINTSTNCYNVQVRQDNVSETREEAVILQLVTIYDTNVVISSPILTLAPDPVQIHVPTIVDTSVGNTAVLCLTALSPPNNEVTVHLMAMNMNIG